MLGSWLAPILPGRSPHHILVALAEFGNFLGLGIMLSGFFSSGFLLFLLGYSLKCCSIGFFSFYQFDWLKQGLPTDSSFFQSIKGMTQGGYGIAALAILIVSAGLVSAEIFIILDLITSAFAIAIFALCRCELTQSGRQKSVNSGFAIFKYWRILIPDMCLAVALSGTNTFLLKQGESIVDRTYGYFFAMLIYSLAFLLIGRLASRLKLSGTGPLSFMLALLITGFWLMTGSGYQFPSILGLTIVLIAYPAACIVMEGLWFSSLHTTNSKLYSTRTIIVGGIWALGESVLSTNNSDLIIRILFCITGFVFLIPVIWATGKTSLTLDIGEQHAK